MIKPLHQPQIIRSLRRPELWVRRTSSAWEIVQHRRQVMSAPVLDQPKPRVEWGRAGRRRRKVEERVGLDFFDEEDPAWTEDACDFVEEGEGVDAGETGELAAVNALRPGRGEKELREKDRGQRALALAVDSDVETKSLQGEEVVRTDAEEK